MAYLPQLRPNYPPHIIALIQYFGFISQRWLIRSASLRRAHRCLTVSYIKRTIFFKKEFKIDDEALIKFTRKIDISEFGVNKMLQKSELDTLIKDQT